MGVDGRTHFLTPGFNTSLHLKSRSIEFWIFSTTRPEQWKFTVSFLQLRVVYTSMRGDYFLV
jgi:hypothetical protein